MDDPRIVEAMAAGYVPAKFDMAELDKNQDLTGIVSIVVVTALATLVVACRLLSRRFIVKQFGLGLDDVLALISLVIFIPFAIICIDLIARGAGRPLAFSRFVLSYEDLDRIQIEDSTAHLLYSTTLLLCRLSGIAFYFRICTLHREFVIFIRVVLAVMIAGYLAQILLIIFHCGAKVTLMWPYKLLEDGMEFRCLSWAVVYEAISGISLFSDILLFGPPIAMLKSLEMPRARKIQLASILLPGMAVIGISVGRVVLVVFFDEPVGPNESTRLAFCFLRLLVIEASEISATLIALSIPGLKPMVDKFILRKETRNSTCGSLTKTSSNGGGNVRRSLSKVESLESIIDVEDTIVYPKEKY